MSDAPRPGWYPDPAGSGGARWWTGRDWGELAPAPAPAPFAGAPTPVRAYVVDQPPLEPGTTTNTLWAFLQALLPLVSVLTSLPSLLAFPALSGQIIDLERQAASGDLPQSGTSAAMAGAMGTATGATAVTSLLGLVVYAAFVLFASLDARELRRRGVVQPFPWPWAFLSVVYPIGRAVVVRRRVRGSLAPLWVFIAAYAVAILVVIVLTFVLAGNFFEQVATLSPSVPTT